jgi:putative transposase
MARIARVVAPGYPHHVIQRGNRRMDVFFSDDDYLTYITLLKKASLRYSVDIWAYCLMTNHAHFIAVPEKADSLARCFSDVHVRYTRMINKRQEWKGHLWQARFGSNVLDENYLRAAVRYVERNPVRAGIVKNAWEYPWSSAALHVGITKHDELVSGDEVLRQIIGNWKKYLRQAEEDVFVGMIRKEGMVSRPIGEAAFIKKLEKRFQCMLQRGKRGRPPKEQIK